MTTVNEWAQEQWQSADLGDPRRTARAVRMGAQMATSPAASLPGQTNHWGDLKAAYRLLHQEKVTHEALSLPHWQATHRAAGTTTNPVLFIQDGSQLDFTFRDVEDIGRIGDNNGQGLLIHTTMAVDPAEPVSILGLAHQIVWVRHGEAYKRHETRMQRYHRADRESSHWSDAIAAIGPAPQGACWVSVGDRESDIFHYWKKAKGLGWECLLRLKSDRRILAEDGTLFKLKSWLSKLPCMAKERLELRARTGRTARMAQLSLAWGKIQILPPRNDPESNRASPLTAWVLHIWECDAEEGQKPLEWILLSTLAVENAEQAYERVEWYRRRWLIEQYHKALKTGCGMENSQLQDGAALRRLLGFLSIVAVRLLQVETVARTAPKLPATRMVDPQMLTFVCALRKRDASTMTAYEFWREIAKCGGFLARKHDGEPGWQTL